MSGPGLDQPRAAGPTQPVRSRRGEARARRRRLAALAALAAGCGEPAPRVTLAPVAAGDGRCGRPRAATGLLVTAYGDGPEVTRAVALDGPFALAGLPATTRQLGVAVLAGGEVAAVGKTAPFELGALADGAVLPVLMAPRDGACAVGPMTEARRAPLLARAGDLVLVVGGDGPDGPLASAEVYDPATATFAPVELPEALRAPSALVGAALTSLPDGRVALSGRAIALFDPAAGRFEAPVLAEPRAFHAALALDAGRLLVAGGCAQVDGAACAPPVRRSARVYPVADLGRSDAAPALTAGLVGAVALDEGLGADGVRTVVVAGGAAEPGAPGSAGAGTRLAPDGDRATALAGLAAVPARLDGGAVLTAFAPPGAPPAGDAAILAVGGAVAVPAAPAPARDGARLVALEDGSVLGVGGGAGVVRYDPTADAWRVEAPGGDAPDAPGPVSAIRLADGAVLVVGGGAGAPSAQAWVYRPGLVGPFSGSAVAVPAAGADVAGGATLTPSDPAAVRRDGGRWRLTAPTVDALGLGGRGLVGGPRAAEGAVTVVADVAREGVALVAAQAAAGEALLAVVAGGEVRVRRGRAAPACVAPAPALAGTTATLSLELRGGVARVRAGGALLVACEVGALAPGAWGIAAAGPDADVAIRTVTVER